MAMFCNAPPQTYYYGGGAHRTLVTEAWRLVCESTHGPDVTWQERFREVALVYDDFYRNGLRTRARAFSRCFGIKVPRYWPEALDPVERMVHASALLALSEACRAGSRVGSHAASVLRDALPDDGPLLWELVRDALSCWALREGIGAPTDRGSWWWFSLARRGSHREVAATPLIANGVDLDALPDEDALAAGSLVEVPLFERWGEIARCGLAAVEGRFVLSAQPRDLSYLAPEDVRAWRVAVLEVRPVRRRYAVVRWRPCKRDGWVCAQAGRFVYGADLRAALRRLRQRVRADIAQEAFAA